jgi:hypothetical protein
MIKFIREDIYKILCALTKQQLENSKKELLTCLANGTMRGGYGETIPNHSYQKELEFIEYRLRGVKSKGEK